jgi:Flp pilus assembly protein TadD
MLDMPLHALRELEAAGESADCAFDYHSLCAEALRQNRDHELALDAFRRARAERPNDVSVLLGMAWCYKRTRQLPRAIAVMEEAYRISPDEPIVLYNLSCYYSLQGNKAKALSWLGRALRMRAELRKLIADETDFDSLRDDPDFQFIADAHKIVDEV